MFTLGTQETQKIPMTIEVLLVTQKQLYELGISTFHQVPGVQIYHVILGSKPFDILDEYLQLDMEKKKTNNRRNYIGSDYMVVTSK